MNTTPESVVTKYCSRRLAIFLHILFIVRNATIAALACYQGVQAEARGSSHVAPYVNRGAQELGGERGCSILVARSFRRAPTQRLQSRFRLRSKMGGYTAAHHVGCSRAHLLAHSHSSNAHYQLGSVCGSSVEDMYGASTVSFSLCRQNGNSVDNSVGRILYHHRLMMKTLTRSSVGMVMGWDLPWYVDLILCFLFIC